MDANEKDLVYCVIRDEVEDLKNRAEAYRNDQDPYRNAEMRCHFNGMIAAYKNVIDCIDKYAVKNRYEEALSEFKYRSSIDTPLENKSAGDIISAPSHYVEGRKYEPRKVITDWGLDWNLGNVVKYISRAGRKDSALEDLKKAAQYLQWEIEALEGGEK